MICFRADEAGHEVVELAGVSVWRDFDADGDGGFGGQDVDVGG